MFKYFESISSSSMGISVSPERIKRLLCVFLVLFLLASGDLYVHNRNADVSAGQNHAETNQAVTVPVERIELNEAEGIPGASSVVLACQQTAEECVTPALKKRYDCAASNQNPDYRMNRKTLNGCR